MTASKKQIDDLINSNMYWNDNEPMHKEVNDYVRNWFTENEKEEKIKKEDEEKKEESNFESEALKKNENILPEPSKEEKTTLPKIAITDDDLVKRNLPEITKWEGAIDHAYKDKKGVVTTGKGIRSDSTDFYHSLDWRNKDTQAKGTYDEVESDFQSIMNAPIGNYTADYYRNYTLLRLSNEEMNKQTLKHLEEDLKQIRDNIKNFDKLPPELQDVIIDIQFNTGHIEKFNLLQKAIQEKNIRDIIIESHRKDIPEERNKAMGKKILKITDWDY